MTHSTKTAMRRLAVGAAATVAALGSLSLAACSSGPVGGCVGVPSDLGGDETLEIAYFSFAVNNTYDEPMLACAQAVADANNANITVFDSNLDPALQAQQIVDATNSGLYDGFITQPVYGPAILEAVQGALDEGITVVNIDQILGEDFTTQATQVEGLSANVVFNPYDLGFKGGQQVIAACASKNLDPCEVAYLHDIKESGIGYAFFAGYTDATAGTASVVTTDVGDTYYTPASAQALVADILTSNPDVDLFVSSDQALQGAFLAIEDAGFSPTDFLFVGYGGAEWAQQKIAAGEVFADILQAPATEGKLGMIALLKALRGQGDQGDIDPFEGFPNEGVITKSNEGQFVGEWVG